MELADELFAPSSQLHPSLHRRGADAASDNSVNADNQNDQDVDVSDIEEDAIQK